MKFPVWRDVWERVWTTFIEGAVAVFLASGLDLAHITDLNVWKAAGVGGLTALLALLKSFLASRFGKKGASLDPAVGIAPDDSANRPVQ